MNKHVVILICFLICQHYLYAQDDAIFTDRPGQTDAVYTMGKGYFQIESGFFYSTDEMAGVKITTSTTPNVMIKYGVIDRIEVKLFLDLLQLKEDTIAVTETKNSGLAPIRLATKVFLIEGDGWMPAASLTGILSLPNTGDNAFQHKDVKTSIRLQMENSISENVSLNYSIGGDWSDNNNSQGVYTIVLGSSFSDKLGGWVELYGTFSNDFRDTFATDFGMAYLLTDYLQLDTSIGIGLNDAATDFFFNLGISWKTSLLNK